MARKIYISSDMSIDERLMSVGERAALLWPWLLLALDDWGRAEASPRRLKAQVFPMLDSLTPDDIAEALSSYSSAGLILLYSIDGKDFMAVPPVKWFRYQTHVRSEKRSNDASHIPAPPCATATELTTEAKNGSARDRAHLREDAREIALHHTTPHHHPSPSLSPPPSTTPPRRAAARALSGGAATPGLVGGGDLENLVSVLGPQGMSRAEIECALAEISLHPPKRAIRNWVSIVTTVITRQREERGAMPVAVSPVDAEAEAQARWERDKAERDRKNAEVSKKLPPEARAAAAAVVAEAKQREAANGKAQG